MPVIKESILGNIFKQFETQLFNINHLTFSLIFLGKCPHVQPCVKVTNLKNDIPHADLSKCQECKKLPPEDDKKLEGEKGNDNDIQDPSQASEGPTVCVCLRCGSIVSI